MGLRFNQLLRAMGGGDQSIGGVNIGTAGAGIYAGFTLADGDEFRSLDLASGIRPAGSYFTTRGYRAALAELRAPAAGALAVMHDVDPDYTGWNDSNRGVPLAFDSHSIVAGEGTSALRLHTIRQTAGEQVKLATGVSGQIERGSMIHTAGRMWINSPGITEFRARIPAGPAGQHPTLWLLSTQPTGGPNITGNEYGFEGSGARQQAYNIDWNANVSTVSALDIGTTYRDGAYHTFTIVCSATDFKYYIDGSLVNTVARSPDSRVNKADYILITNHVYNATFLTENYSAAAWAAASSGVDMDIEWLRMWRQNAGAHFLPLASIPDVAATAGGAINIVLPSQSTLWGSTGLTEYVLCIPAEVEEPGGDAGYGQFPTGISYDSGTRTISGTMPAQSGALHFAVGVTQNGCTCRPARFRVTAAPVYTGLTTMAFTNGTPVSLDIYALWDVGRLFGSAANPKGLSVSGLPAGLGFSSSTGLLTGTPTTNSTGSMSFSATNNVGQTSTQAVSWVVSASATGVPAPTITGSPALLASWDFGNASSVTTSGGSIDSVAGSDGTSIVLSQTGGGRPTLVSRNSKNAARFTAASSQNMRAASNLGIASQATFVVIGEPVSIAVSQTFLDVSVGTDNFSTNRHTILLSSATGYNYRKMDSTGANNSNANQGAAASAGMRLLVARGPSGTSNSKLNVDGAGTALVAATTSAAPTLTGASTTLGADISSSAITRPLDGWVWRVLVYSTALTDAQCEEIAVWAAANYGTNNAA